MEIEAIQKVLNSDIFKNWHTDEYLVSYLLVTNTPSVDFYSKKTKKITSFIISDKINLKEDEIFQKEAKDLEELKLEDIKISLEQATQKIENIKTKKIPSEQVNKKIIILQQQIVPIWNLTYLTSSLNLLNIKINAINGDIIEEKLESLLSFKK